MLRRDGPQTSWLKCGLLAVMLALALGLVLINALAFLHARRFMQFVPGARRPKAAGELSWHEKAAYLVAGVRMPRPENRRTPREVGLFHARLILAGRDNVPLEAWLVPNHRPRGCVLLFHGYADAKDALLAQARVLHELGFGLLLLDFRGSGGSGGSTSSIGYFEADDVAVACAAVERLPLSRPVVLYGASMGAAAVLRAMDVHRPAVDALVLEAPFDRLVTTVAHRFTELGVPPHPSADLLLFWGGLQQGFDARAFAPVDHARSVRVPTLVIVGDRDPYVRVSEAEAIRASIRASARLEIVPGLRHRSWISQDPLRWRHVVSGFLDDSLRGADGRARARRGELETPSQPGHNGAVPWGQAGQR